MRLGGPVFEKCSDPGQWAAAVKRLGYGAAYCPVAADAPADVVRGYVRAAEKADIIIAEVGAWSNPLSTDDKARNDALEHCRRQLALADRIGARCCVNIAGSRGAKWDGPCRDDLAAETFDLIVETVRSIIDAVEPAQTFYALETMPWMVPDSPDAYLRLVQAIDRRHFAVHFDPVNLINSPRRYFDTAAVIREFCHKLAPHIRSCHAKDILLGESLTVHLSEVPPGKGALDFGVYLQELTKLNPDTPLMLEHMAEEDYAPAAEYIRSVASEVGVRIR